MAELEKLRQICREAIGNCHYSLCARSCAYRSYGYPMCMEVCLSEALLKSGVRVPGYEKQRKEDKR